MATLTSIFYHPSNPTAILTLQAGLVIYGKLVSLAVAKNCCEQAIAQGFKPHLKSTIGGMIDVTFRRKK